jgi:hypothetical protein
MCKKTYLKKCQVISIVLVTLFPGSIWAAGTYSGGNGEPNDPYLISTAVDMAEIGTHPEDWDNCFLLTADINLSDYNETNFNLIGKFPTRFTGIFDGNNHTISNFTWNSKSTDHIVGLFVYLDGSDAEIRDLKLIDPNVHTYGDFDNIGALVGMLMDGKIIGCSIEGGTVSGSGYYYTGGLVGLIGRYGTISNCYVNSSVSGDDHVGGLVGENEGIISNCYVKGSVSGIGAVGGLAGENHYGSISNCHSTCSIQGDNSLGGLVGFNDVNSIINNCYATGSVQGDKQLGGLVGTNSGTVINCFWDVTASGISYSEGGFGRTTTQMMNADIFVGWSTEWTIDEGNDYPRLAWENAGGTVMTVPVRTYSGDGVSTPFTLTNADDLMSMMAHQEDWDKKFELDSNIDMSGVSCYLPPGGFSGTIDGKDYTISNLTINEPGGSFLGLIGICSDSNITNLGIIDINITGYSYLGGLVGRKKYSSISNCYTTGQVHGGSDYVGGLGGYASSSNISCCYANCSVQGDSWIGGLIGMVGGSIINCYSNGNVAGNMYVGGLVGGNGGSIINCYAKGSVIGDTYVGGLVGTNIGSLVGMGGGPVINCFWDVTASGISYSEGGFGRTTAQMMDSNTFVGWSTEWTIDEGNDYPRLAWENAGGTVMTVPARTYSGDGVSIPFTLTNADDLISMTAHQEDWDKKFELDSNIDMSGVSGYLPPGDFSGTIDGKDYTISNLTIDEPGGSFLGLIGICSDSNIINLDIIDINITGYSYLGCLVGIKIYGNINNCCATGRVHGGGDYVGGLVGFEYMGSINNCYVTGWIHGEGDCVGGLVGHTRSSNISDCYATGWIQGDDGFLGGLVGLRSYGDMINCYATCNVIGNRYVGGLVGRNIDSTSTSYNVNNCYASGSITGSMYVGGLVGDNLGNISNCYAASNITGSSTVGGMVGINSDGAFKACFWDNTINPTLADCGYGNVDLPNVFAETTENMQIQATFTNQGWDFVGETTNGTEDIWIIDEGVDYPRLTLEFDRNNNGVFDYL